MIFSPSPSPRLVNRLRTCSQQRMASFRLALGPTAQPGPAEALQTGRGHQVGLAVSPAKRPVVPGRPRKDAKKTTPGRRLQGDDTDEPTPMSIPYDGAYRAQRHSSLPAVLTEGRKTRRFETVLCQMPFKNGNSYSLIQEAHRHGSRDRRLRSNCHSERSPRSPRY